MKSRRRQRADLLDKLALLMAEREDIRDTQREIALKLSRLSLDLSNFNPEELITKGISGPVELLRAELKEFPRRMARAADLDREVAGLSRQLDQEFDMALVATFTRRRGR